MNLETPSRGMWFLIALGAIELLALSALGWGGLAFPLPGVGAFTVAAAAYGIAALASRRLANAPTTLYWIMGIAVLMRVVLLPAELRLSDDLWRYLWDGHVGGAGINPYLFAPADPALTELRTAWHSLINNPAVPTIYGPAAQLAFRAIQVLGGTVLSAKIVWVALDGITVWLLLRYAVASNRHVPFVAVAYAWSPLLIVETAWSGHLEPLGLLFVVALLALTRAKRATLAGVALAGAVMTKFAPIAIAPAVFARLGASNRSRTGGWAFVAGLVITLALGFLPFIDAGPKIWTGLATYAEHWRFNTGAFSLIEAFFANPLHARAAVAAVVGFVVAATAWRRVDAEQATLWVLGVGVALSPTVHPWYVLWLLPVAALRGSLPWLYLSCSVFLAYWGLDTFHSTGQWPEPAWVRACIWLPFFILLIHSGLKSRRTLRTVAQGAQGEPGVTGSEQ